MVAVAPPDFTWSIRLCPNSPLEFANPFENSGVEEFSRMRTDSRAEAHRKIALARNSIVARVLASMTRTAVAFRERASKLRLCTTLCGRKVILPVFSAAGRVAVQALKVGRGVRP